MLSEYTLAHRKRNLAQERRSIPQEFLDVLEEVRDLVERPHLEDDVEDFLFMRCVLWLLLDFHVQALRSGVDLPIDPDDRLGRILKREAQRTLERAEGRS